MNNTSDNFQMMMQQAAKFESNGDNQNAITLYRTILAQHPNVTHVYPRLFHLQGIRIDADVDFLMQAFHSDVLPAFQTAVANRAIDQALDMEMFIYNTIVKRVETESHYQRCYSQLAPVLEQLGELVNRRLPAPKFATYRPGERLKLAFVFPNNAMLAHTEVILSVLEGVKNDPDSQIDPVIYVLTHISPQEDAFFQQAFTALGVPIVYMADQLPVEKKIPSECIQMLRKAAEIQQIHAAIWVSVPVFISFATAMRFAPVQIWWAMRYHPNAFNHLDGRIGGGALFKDFRQINGQRWRSVFVAYKDLYDAKLTPQAQEIRQQHAGRVILGSVARSEKMMDPEFIQTLTDILRANPNAVFLWTGRDHYLPFQQALDDANVAAQCHFIGWVNSKLYAQVFDVYIDSFPSGSGLTAIQAMAAGTPVVGMNNYLSMLGNFVYPAYHGEAGTREIQAHVRNMFTDKDSGQSLLTCADSSNQYVAMTQMLIDNLELRKAAGEAQKQFVNEYLSDQIALANRIETHVRDIIKDSARKQRKIGGNRQRRKHARVG